MKNSSAFNSETDSRQQPKPAAVLPDAIALPTEWLEHVAGGLNPQPLPPCHEDVV
jgi:hypothetical protein